MRPVYFPQATKTLGREECGDLAVYSDGQRCISCWSLSWRERLTVLLTGRLWLWVHSGQTQPPVALQAETPFVSREAA